MTWRRRAPGRASWTVTAGAGLALLVAIAAIGAVHATRGQASAPAQVDEAPPAARLPTCSNLEDDDEDGLTDLDDPDCLGPMDEGELDPPRRPPPAPDPQPTLDPAPTPDPPPTSNPSPTPNPPLTPDPPPAPSPPSSLPPGGAGDGTGGRAGGGKTGPGGNTGGGGGTRQGASGGSGGHGGHGDRRADGRGGHGSGGTPAPTGQRRKPVRLAPIRAPKGVSAKSNSTPSAADFGTPPIGVPSFTVDRFEIPTFLLPLYRECASQYGLRWQVLAAINEVETAFGTNLNVSTAGAVGWMQFMPSTWSSYGVDADGDGDRDPYDPHDAICSAANYLHAAGAPGDMRGAIFAYNHAEWYVDLVLGLTRQYESVYLPEPLPRAKRLDRDFARRLVRIARRHDVGWALVLAILRVRGDKGRIPASADEVRAIAKRIARVQPRTRSGRLGVIARSLFAKRPAELKVAAMTRYNRAVGLRGLVGGLHSVEPRLRRRALESERILLYPGGRDDIKAGRIDPLVLTLLLYLAEKHDKVTITSLVSGHGYFARPGVPSMHVFGRAVDIAAVGGAPILGHQQPGGVTEDVLRDILLLPDELQPAQVISLIDLGGPSFAASDHHDHIHVGF